MIYSALDFETANRCKDSAISIGIVKFDSSGEELDSYYSLIKPPVMYFDPLCSAIHGLSEEDVKDAPRFCEIWDDIYSFTKDTSLIAHNAPFDMNILKGTLSTYNIKEPDYTCYCTLALSRRILKELPCHKLEYLMDRMGIKYNAHNALSDAEACGKLFFSLCGESLEDENFFTTLFKNTDKKRRYPRKFINF